jgi:hypothetical protein
VFLLTHSYITNPKQNSLAKIGHVKSEALQPDAELQGTANEGQEIGRFGGGPVPVFRGRMGKTSEGRITMGRSLT